VFELTLLLGNEAGFAAALRLLVEVFASRGSTGRQKLSLDVEELAWRPSESK
jgi:hypothetical protein